MSEKIKLADLMKEKMQEEAANEVQQNTQVEEVRTEVNTAPEPVTFDNNNFDLSNMESANLSELVPSGVEDVTKKAQDEIDKELDDSIAAAFERRFKPAMEEAREIYQEYKDLVAMGEENPRVVAKYDSSLDLDPNLSDAQVDIIRANQKEEIIPEEKIPTIGFNDDLEDDDDMVIENDVINKSESVIETESIKPDINTTEEVKPINANLDEDKDENLDYEIMEDDDFLEDLGLDEEKEEAERIEEEKRTKRNLEEFSRVLKKQLELDADTKPDISTFKVRKRPVAISNVLSKPTETKFYEWGLFATGVSISMSPLSAIELNEINPYNTHLNDITRARTLLSTLYRHLSHECRKDIDMESWTRLINYKDLNHLFFALYNANFSTSNIIPMSCPKCKHFFTEKRSIIDMVNFGTEESKSYFEKIIAKDPSVSDYIEEEIYVANGEYAFGIVVPTIYNSMFEERLLNDSFREKYAGIINISHCISTVYEIDQKNEELIPIQFKIVANDITKTYKYRIRGIYKILSKLSAYDFKDLQDNIAKIIDKNEKEVDISYQVPESVCPKCKSIVPAIPMNAQELVFTRHRLIHMLD